MELSSIAYYVTDKISSDKIVFEQYVTTDCISQNKHGREVATNLPPQPCKLIRYKCGYVLVANIRPYIKRFGLQTWMAAHHLMCLFSERKMVIHQDICTHCYFKMLSMIMLCKVQKVARCPVATKTKL